MFVSAAIMNLVAVAVPGPDFFYVSRTAVSSSKWRAVQAVLGIVLGVSIWCTLAILGMHTVFRHYPVLQYFIALVGSCYLLYMAQGLLRGAWIGYHQKPMRIVVQTPKTVKNPFLYGFLTNITNPKVLTFYAGVLSAILRPGLRAWRMGAYFVIFVGETLLWFLAVAFLFGQEKIQVLYRKMSYCIDGLAGIIFAGFGLYLGWGVMQSLF